MRIEVRVQTKSSRACIEKTGRDTYKVHLSEAPQKGRANKVLVRMLADYFGVAKNKISILQGETSRRKIVNIAEGENP